MFQRSFGFFAAALLLCFIGGVARSQSAPIVYADSITAVAGVEFNRVVASVDDYADYANVYSVVSIDWGDGQTSSGTLSEYSFPVYDVWGTHTYAAPGSYVTKITVMDADGLSGSSSGSAVVSGALTGPSVSANSIGAVEGTAFAGTVASITDTYSTNAADFAASIKWGDGQTSSGLVSANGSGGFDVTGSHLYTKAGSYVTKVTVLDAGGGSGSGSGSAVVADAPLTATGLNIQSGKSFSGVVATFTDANPYAAASDFTATIQWGDGTKSSAGAIYAMAGGGFSVSGSHTYRKPGIYAVTVTIKDAGGSTAIASTTINVKK